MALLDKLRSLSQEGQVADPASLVADWRKAVDELYHFIAVSLHEFTEQSYGRLEFRFRTVREDELGEYQISDLLFVSGAETIVFAPFRRVLLGARGRVDVYRQGRISDGLRLLRSEATGPGALPWSIVQPRESILSMPHDSAALTKASLERLIEVLLP